METLNKSMYRIDLVEILQVPVSDNHTSAMFFHGVVAWSCKKDKIFVLRVENDGELVYEGKEYVGKEIRQLGLEFLINDEDIQFEKKVDIQVDAWFVISQVLDKNFNSVLYAEEQDESLIYDNYDEAIKGFKEFFN
jgi:hypothetical protein